jgi:hypothetical protein
MQLKKLVIRFSESSSKKKCSVVLKKNSKRISATNFTSRKVKRQPLPRNVLKLRSATV